MFFSNSEVDKLFDRRSINGYIKSRIDLVTIFITTLNITLNLILSQSEQMYSLIVIKHLLNILALVLTGYGIFTQIRLVKEIWKPFSTSQRILNFVSNTLVISSLLMDSNQRNLSAMTLIFCALNILLSPQRDSFANMVLGTSFYYLWLLIYRVFLDTYLLNYEILITTICSFIIMYHITDMMIVKRQRGYPSLKNTIYVVLFVIMLVPGLTVSRYFDVYPITMSALDQYPFIAIALTIDYIVYTSVDRMIEPKMYIVLYLSSSVLRFFAPNTNLVFFVYALICGIVTIYKSRENLLWRNVRTYCCGVFDMMHEGHMELFKKMSKCGDVIVGVIDDKTVASYKRKPVMSHEERCKAVMKAKFVDDIIPHCPLDTTREFMDMHEIDIVGIGEEYFKPPYTYYKDCVDLNKYVIIPRYTGISTSDLIRRISNRQDLDKNKQNENQPNDSETSEKDNDKKDKKDK